VPCDLLNIICLSGFVPIFEMTDDGRTLSLHSFKCLVGDTSKWFTRLKVVGHPSKHSPGPTSINFIDQTNVVNRYATLPTLNECMCSFLSCLITGVLTHHLSWASTVAPVGDTPASTYLDKHMAKWVSSRPSYCTLVLTSSALRNWFYLDLKVDMFVACTRLFGFGNSVKIRAVKLTC